MGRVKDDWIEAQQRGWVEIDKSVCEQCLEEPDLWKEVAHGAAPGHCDYCDTERVPVVPVSAVQGVLYAVMHSYYAEPAEAGTPYVEGAYAIDILYTDEVLGRLGFGPAAELLEDILGADLVEAWVPAANGSWADAQEHEVLLYSWASFSHAVKHQTRFHFQRLERDPHDREVQVSDMLDVVQRSLAPLVRIVEAGTRVFRARHLSQQDRDRAQAHMFGAPPKEKATAGRMNPAGFPYFYSAMDAATAIAEIGTPPAGRTPVAAEFVINRSLRVVDFTQLPSEPSIFALDRKQEREQVLFLSGFVQSITQPVTKDGREHIDYVPSQVVCEYLAQVAFRDNGEPLDAVIFPSSVRDEGTNFVIFPSGEWFQTDRFPEIEFVGLA